MKRLSLLVLSVFVLGFLGLRSSSAAGDTTSSNSSGSSLDLGVLGGIASLNNSGGSPFTYGLQLDYSLDSSWRLGLQFNTMSPNSISLLGTSYSQTLSNLSLAIKYAWDSFDLGILLGTNFYSANVPGATNSSFMIYGALASYDFSLANNFSIGPQLEYITSNQSNGFSEFDFLAVIKYWF